MIVGGRAGFHPQILVWGGSGQGSFTHRAPPPPTPINYVLLGDTEVLCGFYLVLNDYQCLTS